MSDGLFAREYARLFDRLAPGERKDVQEYLASLGDSGQELAGLRNFLNHPAIPNSDKLDALRAASPAAFTPVVWRVLGDILNRRMSFIFPAIAGEMERLSEEEQHIHEVGITSAQPLSAAQQTALVEKLAAYLGGTIKPLFGVDPTLLGGMLIKIGDTIMDNTIKTDLDHLRSKLSTISST
jgi:F-type H+-transporting ATPase subunit delta